MFSKLLKLLFAGSFLLALFQRSDKENTKKKPSKSFQRETSESSNNRETVEFTPSSETASDVHRNFPDDQDDGIRSPG